MVPATSNLAMQAFIEQACALHNYDQLKTYGISIRPDILIKGKVIIKHQGNNFNCKNDPDTIKIRLKELLLL
ncbi:hypothetical protein [Adhaeribacter radiodurans]|uniref:Thioredoxin family protein n=1 Tax=Adhaeribacter radiodurans TaxID=2745197 RepID=A0A7L7L2D9_9BACT|nr:hypothetical protein [Adhaeribacter radiodurans]QMU26923.1 hypothetical protein HUW48_02235 [Adhaeribacter radiodurans]